MMDGNLYYLMLALLAGAGFLAIKFKPIVAVASGVVGLFVSAMVTELTFPTDIGVRIKYLMEMDLVAPLLVFTIIIAIGSLQLYMEFSE